MTDMSLSSRDVSYATDFPDSHDNGYSVVNDNVVSEVKPGLRKAVTINSAPNFGRVIPDVLVDDSRDALLTPFGKATMDDRYLTENESYQDRFANCVRYYADTPEHAQRMYDYISKLWCMPPTPILSNGGTTKGNLISCFLNSYDDSLESIIDGWKEVSWMGARGGGTGTYIGKIREIGAKVGVSGKTSGAMSFVKVNDALASCISQGSNRRAAGAMFMDISHPEIVTFMEMRQESGGDPSKKALNLHHGVLIPDAFYDACENNEMWDLVSPHTGEVKEQVSARYLMEKLLMCRMAKGEPYIINIDHVNRAVPEHHRRSNLFVTASNLCVEITLPTGVDHHGVDRTAICCLFQPNAETFEQWKDDPLFFEDIGRFLDNVLQDFIDNAGSEFTKSRYAAMRERSIGVGMMGFHGFLQSKGIPFEDVMAKVWNKKIFKRVKEEMDRVSCLLAEERGACPDAAEHGFMERFSYKTALAPTASVSIICGGASAGGDIIAANIYTQKTLDGSFEVRNPHLEKVLDRYSKNTKDVWKSILNNGGSVQHLDFLTDREKDVFKTSFEVNPIWAIEHAADRLPYIDQSQSLNLFIRPDIDKRTLLKLHMLAHKRGIKTLYYLRSYSLADADASDGSKREMKAWKPEADIDYAECLSCQ